MKIKGMLFAPFRITGRIIFVLLSLFLGIFLMDERILKCAKEVGKDVIYRPFSPIEE